MVRSRLFTFGKRASTNGGMDGGVSALTRDIVIMQSASLSTPFSAFELLM